MCNKSCKLLYHSSCQSMKIAKFCSVHNHAKCKTSQTFNWNSCKITHLGKIYRWHLADWTSSMNICVGRNSLIPFYRSLRYILQCTLHFIVFIALLWKQKVKVNPGRENVQLEGVVLGWLWTLWAHGRRVVYQLMFTLVLYISCQQLVGCISVEIYIWIVYIMPKNWGICVICWVSFGPSGPG